MTWRHVALISGALLLVAVCGVSSNCRDQAKDADQLAGLVIVGTLGHAGHASKRETDHTAP